MDEADVGQKFGNGRNAILVRIDEIPDIAEKFVVFVIDRGEGKNSSDCFYRCFCGNYSDSKKTIIAFLGWLRNKLSALIPKWSEGYLYTILIPRGRVLMPSLSAFW